MVYLRCSITAIAITAVAVSIALLPLVRAPPTLPRILFKGLEHDEDVQRLFSAFDRQDEGHQVAHDGHHYGPYAVQSSHPQQPHPDTAHYAIYQSDLRDHYAHHHPSAYPNYLDATWTQASRGSPVLEPGTLSSSPGPSLHEQRHYNYPPNPRHEANAEASQYLWQPETSHSGAGGESSQGYGQYGWPDHGQPSEVVQHGASYPDYLEGAANYDAQHEASHLVNPSVVADDPYVNHHGQPSAFAEHESSQPDDQQGAAHYDSHHGTTSSIVHPDAALPRPAPGSLAELQAHMNRLVAPYGNIFRVVSVSRQNDAIARRRSSNVRQIKAATPDQLKIVREIFKAWFKLRLPPEYTGFLEKITVRARLDVFPEALRSYTNNERISSLPEEKTWRDLAGHVEVYFDMGDYRVKVVKMAMDRGVSKHEAIRAFKLLGFPLSKKDGFEWKHPSLWLGIVEIPGIMLYRRILPY